LHNEGFQAGEHGGGGSVGGLPAQLDAFQVFPGRMVVGSPKDSAKSLLGLLYNETRAAS
jgi:hypothetical protein